MAQHDYVIANDTAANVRSDLNDALSAIVSQNSGASAPSTTYANMLWYDTSNNILKMRSEADDAWIDVGYIDQTANAFRILDDTQVTNTSGTQTGLLGDQSTASWETGTGTTESLVSPAKVKAAIDALATTESPIKAWVSFDGTGTVSIRESFNVSSITDNGTGLYTINFSTALTDTNYALVATCEATPGSSGAHSVVLEDASKPATGSCRINTRTNTGSFDSNIVNVIVVR